MLTFTQLRERYQDIMVGRHVSNAERTEFRHLAAGVQSHGIDPTKFPPKPGMDGPSRAKNGHIVYFDQLNLQYFDATTNQYLDPGTDVYERRALRFTMYIREGMNPYQQIITAFLTKQGLTQIEPRWVEAYMRMEYGTLDGLSPKKFEGAMFDAVEGILQDGYPLAAKVADTYGPG